MNRAATAAEVLLWAQRPAAADGGYGTGCGLSLAGQGGLPAIGNFLYRFSITGSGGTGFVGLGVSRTSLDLGIIMPSLAGCMLHSSVDFSLNAGAGIVPLPIPSNVALDGATLYAQAILLTGAGWKTSNALGVSLGF